MLEVRLAMCSGEDLGLQIGWVSIAFHLGVGDAHKALLGLLQEWMLIRA